MAELPQEITTTVLDLQRQLLAIISKARTTEFTILERYGETEATIIDFAQLQNTRERAETYYSRFCTLLLQIAKSYPSPSSAMLELLARSIEQAQANAPASEASIQEIKRDWNLL
ncbi:hypothetical protein [Argonema antarcticum]|uniref:hypothetical protein n=1 Tax=Argonema antarcticum TaxID=2942763 RepID=UPI00201327F4|nr:hypothetical protein [Argonema antarcticum]MCL1474985.1 hypothetical protein [Argonema antarcticum A004/B2]